MTPKQSEAALKKSMERLTAAQNAVAHDFVSYCDCLEELEKAKADVAEKQAAFVAAHRIPSEE